MALRLTFLSTVVYFFSNWNKLDPWLTKEGKNGDLLVKEGFKQRMVLRENFYIACCNWRKRLFHAYRESNVKILQKCKVLQGGESVAPRVLDGCILIKSK